MLSGGHSAVCVMAAAFPALCRRSCPKCKWSVALPYGQRERSSWLDPEKVLVIVFPLEAGSAEIEYNVTVLQQRKCWRFSSST